VRVQLEAGWAVEVVDRSGDVPEPGTPVTVGLDPSGVVIVPT
jgi:hypothetical protein